MADTDALLHAAADDATTRSRAVARRRAAADVSERARDAASREQHRLRAGYFRARRNGRTRARPCSCCRSGTPMPGGHVGPVPAARDERHDGAAPQPAVSRSAHAARTAPRRLHRQRERRADACRCAGRRCSTRGARSRGSPPQGYERIGILGTSLGSCLSLLTTAHEPLIQAQALNHISPHFADVVWRGLSTRHVREGLDGHIELDLLRDAVEADQPALVSRAPARPPDAARLRALRPDVSGRSVARISCASSASAASRTRSRCCRCGHYSTGKTPFKFVDGWILTRFLKRRCSALERRLEPAGEDRATPIEPVEQRASAACVSAAARRDRADERFEARGGIRSARRTSVELVARRAPRSAFEQRAHLLVRQRPVDPLVAKQQTAALFGRRSCSRSGATGRRCAGCTPLGTSATTRSISAAARLDDTRRRSRCTRAPPAGTLELPRASSTRLPARRAATRCVCEPRRQRWQMRRGCPSTGARCQSPAESSVTCHRYFSSHSSAAQQHLRPGRGRTARSRPR